MRKASIFIWLFVATLSWGQSTSVTLQVVDADGQAWGNGTWSAVLTTPPGNPVPPIFKLLGTNTTVPNQQQGGVLSLTGSTSLIVTPNASVAPAGTIWSFSVCPQATAACFTQTNTIGGSSQTIVLSPPAIRISLANPPPIVLAYNDIEITNQSTGSQYFNISSLAQRIWIGNQWINLSNSGGGGGNGTQTASVTPLLIPFGTVQIGNPVQAIEVISNTGTQSIIVTGASLTVGSVFTLPTPTFCNGVLLAGASCALPVQYQPVASTNDSDVLTITTTAPIDPQNLLVVNLIGSGTVGATFPITLIGFGTGSCNVTDTANVNSLNANFSAGQTSGTSIFNYASGTPVTLTATPNTGSIFNNFGGTGITTTSPSPFTVTMAQTISVTCNLAPVNNNLTLAFTGQGSGGVVSDVSSTNGILNCNGVAGQSSSGGAQGCNGPFPQGTVITLTETPLASNTFTGWIGACPGSTATTCQFTLNSDQTVTAGFASTATINIGLVQTATNCSVVTTTVACNWASAQSATDFLVIGIGLPDATTTVSSVADTKGNTYTQVPTISPKVGTNLTQALYYAQNISAATAGANTTTVTLSSSVGGETFTSLAATHQGGASTTIASASVTCTNGALILVASNAQLVSGNGPGAISSVSGCGLTFAVAKAVDYNSTQGSAKNSRAEVWWAMGTGSSGAITITWATSPTTRGIAVSKVTGTDPTTPIGISATNTGSGTSATVTMGTFGSASNGTYGAFGLGASQSRTAGSGMTVLGADNYIGDESATSNITSVAETFGAGAAWGGIGIEIKATAAGRRDVRALEYSGILQSGSPIDVSAAAVGTSATAAPGSMTTTVASDLITDFNLSSQSVNTPATSFTQRVKNSFGDDAEDIEGAATGAYNPSVALSASGNWVASQVSFKPQTGQAPTVFSATVNLLGNGSGSITGNIGNPLISCPSTCSSQVLSGSTLTLTATANSGSVFVSWNGITGCGTSAICQVPNITSNQNVSATFNLAGQQLYFVNGTTGSDSNDGLAATVGGGHGPWKTYTHADSFLRVGASGTIVSYAPFNYDEVVTMKQGGSSFARVAHVCNTPWTVGGSNCRMREIDTYGVNNVDIGALGKLGFEITNPGGQVAINNNGNFCCGNNNHLLGNYIHDVSTGVCNLSGAILATKHATSPQTGLVVQSNLIDLIGNFGGSCNTMQGIYISEPGAIVEDNIVTRAASAGLQYYNAACSAVISNNNFLHNGVGMVLYGSTTCSAGFNSVLNNIIDNNLGNSINDSFSGDAGCTTGRQTLYSNNIINGNGNNNPTSAFAACTTVQNQKSEAATSTFVNYTGDATGNYQLKSTSIAINGGITNCVLGGVTPCVSSVDFLNVTRPQRANFDIGAFELP